MKYKYFIDFPNYLVQEDGNVYSLTSNKILRGTTSGQHKYLALDLRYNGTRKRMYIHRMVAMLFVDGYSEDKEVNHLNGNKRDNRASNLEWVTRQQNIQHCVDVLGHHKNERNSGCKFSNKLVEQIRKEYEAGNIKQSELADKYQVSRMQIHRIVKNKLRRIA